VALQYIFQFIHLYLLNLQSLTKLPSDYPDKKGQPHVQVALRMQSRGMHVQAGDVIPYIMCEVHTQLSIFILHVCPLFTVGHFFKGV